MPAPAPPDVEPAGPPRTELQELQYKAGEVTDDVSTLFSFWNVLKEIPIIESEWARKRRNIWNHVLRRKYSSIQRRQA